MTLAAAPAQELFAQAQPPRQGAGEVPIQGAPPQQPADPAQVSAIQTEARALPTGRSVRVRLTDGTVRRGRVLGSAEQGLTIQPTPADEPELIEFPRIAAIETGMTTGRKIAIGAGVAAAVAAIALAAN
jgi:hypothetical protein